MPSADSSLPEAKYFSLRSYKKDGNPVDTPVWFARVGDRYVVFTDGTSYKVKRIRRNPSVQIARCDMRGGILGPWIPGRCRPVESEPELVARAYDALNAKYGVIMRLGTLFATLAGRVRRRLILEISLDA